MTPAHQFLEHKTKVSSTIGGVWGGVIAIVGFGAIAGVAYAGFNARIDKAQEAAESAANDVAKLRIEIDKRLDQIRGDLHDINADVKTLLIKRP